MCKNDPVWPKVVILVVAILLFPVSNGTTVPPDLKLSSPPSPKPFANLSDNVHELLDNKSPISNISESSLSQCSANETLYNCTTKDQCCQSNADILVSQLREIKERFQGVDSTIRKDYENIGSIAKLGRDSAEQSLSQLLSPEHSILFPSFNKTIHIMYQILVGFGTPDDLITTTKSLPHQVLHKMLMKSNISKKHFPRTIKGINIFWDLNYDQKSCVVDYMIRSTPLGTIVDDVVEKTRNSTQSMHEYMSLLGSIVKTIRNMMESQQTDECIEEIVKMQHCSICTKSPVCPAFYNQLLSGCIPQLEELYLRWESLMTAMSQLTLRLCDTDLSAAYRGILSVAEFVTTGKLSELIYQHGVLAYMKCVQPDSHKRSPSLTYGRSEENMVPEEELSAVPAKLLDESYVYTPSEDSLIDDLSVKLLRRRSATEHPAEHSTEEVRNVNEEESEGDDEDLPVSTPPESSDEDDHLTQCRGKLGLSFPPLELGSSSSLLNVSISIRNSDCWNGVSVGSYTVDVTSSTKTTRRQEELAIQELDEKMCRYTKECPSASEVRGQPFNNSDHGPSVLRVLASLVPSLYFCCC